MEGATDRLVIPSLMEKNGVPWPPSNLPVFIEELGGVNEILRPGRLELELAASELDALGVVVDADGDAAARWDELRALCRSEFGDLPDRMPAEGLEVLHAVGPRFGVWIMPDNRFEGMLEDLLVRLIPDEFSSLHTNWPGIASPRQEATALHSGMYTRKRQKSSRGSRGRTPRD